MEEQLILFPKEWEIEDGTWQPVINSLDETEDTQLVSSSNTQITPTEDEVTATSYRIIDPTPTNHDMSEY